MDIVTKLRAHSPEKIARGLLEDVKLFVQGEPQSDDITMLVIKKGN
jgi:serine phosphatase RsbU (regulator of sigma subunit)